MGMEEMNLTIRRITRQDTALLFAFFQSLSEQSRRFFRPHPFTMEQAEFITGPELEDPNVRKYLALLQVQGETVPVGYPFMWGWTEEVPFLGIGVNDSFQGMGLGGKLMEFLIREAETNGKKGLQLTTDMDNVRAQALYRRYGFVVTGEGRDGSIGYYAMRLDFS